MTEQQPIENEIGDIWATMDDEINELYSEVSEHEIEAQRKRELAYKKEYEKLKEKIQFDPKSFDPLKFAGEIGEKVLGRVGKETLEELELAYASRVLSINYNPLETPSVKLRYFENQKTMRPFQNLLLYWEKGWLKSTLINNFLKYAIPDKYLWYTISGMSKDMILGSYNEDTKQVIVPVFNHASFAFISELMSFLGEGEKAKEMANALLDVLEGTETGRILVKLNSSKRTLLKSEIERLEKLGIRYLPEDSIIIYNPKSCFLVATKPLGKWTYNTLDTIGFLSRFVIYQPIISDEEAEKWFINDTEMDIETLKKLGQMNKILSGITIKELRVPSKSIMEDVYKKFIEKAKELNKKWGLEDSNLREVISIRLKGDVLRRIVAHAFLKQISRHQKSDLIYDRIVYDKEDLDYVLSKAEQMLLPHIRPLVSREVKKEEKEKPLQIIYKTILEFLLNKGETKKEEIDNELKSKTSISNSTMYRALNHLTGLKLIENTTFGHYKITDKGKRFLEQKLPIP